MIRVNIRNRSNVTLLAKAFMDGLFPRPNKGQIYYDFAPNGELQYLYFQKKYYYGLVESINNPIVFAKVNASNAVNSWMDLINTLSFSEEISSTDSLIKLYSLGNQDTENFNLSEENLTRILESDNQNSWLNIQYDLISLYPELGIEFFEKGCFFKIPFKLEEYLSASFEIIIKVGKKYNLSISDLKITKYKEANSFEISIIFEDL